MNEESRQATLFGDEPVPEKKPRRNWLAPFLHAWTERTGGIPLPAKMARVLEPLCKLHGPQDVLQALECYLNRTEVEKLSLWHFSETYGHWAGRDRVKPHDYVPIDQEYRRRHRAQMDRTRKVGTA